MSSDRKRSRAGRLVGAWLLAIHAGTAAYAADTPGQQRLYAGATSMLARGLDDLAADEFRAYLEAAENGEFAEEARYGLAVALRRLGEPAEALRVLSELAPDPEFAHDFDARQLRGRLLFSQGEHEAAAESLGSVLKDYPDRATVPLHDMHVEALARAGSFAAARDLVTELGEGGLSARGAFFAGFALENLGELSRASAWYERAATSDALQSRALFRAAIAADQGGATQRAIALYDRLADFGSDDREADALYNAALLLDRQGDLEGAVRRLRRVLQSDARSESGRLSRVLLGSILVATDPEEAVTVLKPIADSAQAGWVPEASYWLARAAIALEQPGTAVRLLESSRAGLPERLKISATFDLAVAVELSGDQKRAAELYRSLLSDSNPEDVRRSASEGLARVALGRGEYDQALEAVAAASESSADLGRFEIAALFGSGAYRQCITRSEDWLRKWGAQSGEHALEIAFYRAMASYEHMPFDRARPLLEPFAESRPLPEQYRPAVLALGYGLFDSQEYERASEVLGAYAAFGSGASDRAGALLRWGIACARIDASNQASDVLEVLLREHSESEEAARAAYELGVLAEGLGEGGRAAEYLRLAVGSMEAGALFESDAYRRLGRIVLDSGQGEEAAQLFERAGRSDDEAALAARLDLAMLRAQQGENQEALRILVGLSEQAESPGMSTIRVRALQQAGACYSELGRYEESVRALSMAYELESDAEVQPEIGYQLALALHASGRERDAQKIFESLRDAAGVIGWSASLERAKTQQDDAEKRQLYASLLEEVPDGIDSVLLEQLRYEIGILAFGDGDPEAALRALSEPLDSLSEEERASAAVVSARALLGLGRSREAAATLEAAAQMPDPFRGRALLLRGEAFAESQDWGSSRRAYETYLSEVSGGADVDAARFGVAWSHENDGEAESALPLYLAVAETGDPELAARALFQAGECLFALDRLEDAVRTFIQVDARYAQPEWAAASLYEAGRCLEQLGRRRDAVEMYRDLTERFPSTEWARMAQARMGTPDSNGFPREN